MRQFTKTDIKMLTTNFTFEETEWLEQFLGWHVVDADVTYLQAAWCKKLFGAHRVKWTCCHGYFLFLDEKDAFTFALKWGA